MKPALHWFCIFVGVVGLGLGVVNVGHTLMTPPANEIDELVRVLRYAAGGAQIAPLAGFWFGREVLGSAEMRAWNKQRRAGFVLWLIVAVPMALIGAISAVTIAL